MKKLTRVNKDLKGLVLRATDAGWKIKDKRDGIVLYPPDGGRIVAVHQGQSSNGRAIKNFRQQLREGGLDV